MKAKPAKNIKRYLPGLAVSGLAIVFLAQFVNKETLMDSLTIFSIGDILVLVVIMLCSLVARGFVWKSLLEGLSFRDGFLIVNEGYLFNNLIPRSGEIARVFITSHLTRNDVFQTASAVFFERVIDLLIAAGMLLATLSLALGMEHLQTTAIWIAILFSLILMVAFAVVYFSRAIEENLRSKTFNYEILEMRVKPFLFKILHGLTAISQPRKIIPAFMWILISWVFWVALLYYAILQIQPGAPVWWALFTEGVVAIGIALPSAPANLGVYEGAIVFALSVFGIAKEVALGSAIVLHAIQIGMTTIFGLLGLFTHDFKIGQIIEKIQSGITRKKPNVQEE